MEHLALSRREALACLGVALGGVPTLPAVGAAASSPEAPIPLADFFRRPQFNDMVSSPSGRYLAFTASLHGRMNLVVIDLDQRKSGALTNYDNIDVGRVRWVNDDFLLFSAVQLNAPTGQDGPQAGGLFAVARDGSGIRQLAKTARQLISSRMGGFFAMEFVREVPDARDEMIAAAVVANDDSFDLYRFNLADGRHRLLTQGRPSDRISRWLLDSRLVPRVAIAAADGASLDRLVHYRAGPDAPWRQIARFNIAHAPAFVPLAFDVDDRHLFVASNKGRDNMAIFRVDPEKPEALELLAQHPQYDLGASPQGLPLGSLIRDPKTGELIGLSVDADKPSTVWLDAEMKSLQAAIDGALPGLTNVVRRPRDASRVLVSSYSDTAPGRFYLYDGQARRLEEIGSSRPWLSGRLETVRPFRLRTRDGLEIPGHYVLPRGHRSGQKWPTIVHVHGGPMARDVVQGGRYGVSFGIREAQILASRGYAVVLPNFRVTPELGSRIYYAGIGTFGEQMSDDHEDAAAWAVAQGFADPERIGISGASYGGYAALQALTRPDSPFACAISGLPVTDLKFQNEEADYAPSRSANAYWRQLVGVKDWDEPRARRLSPLHNADKIKRPVFLYIGEDDVRTPPRQAQRMADALKAAGNPVKGLFVGKGEGHGFGVDATNVQLYTQILGFLEDALRR